MARVNPTGWSFEDPLTADQANQIDIRLDKAPNFVDGGAYVPTAPIHIDGSLGGNISWVYPHYPAVEEQDLDIYQGLNVAFISNFSTNTEGPPAWESSVLAHTDWVATSDDMFVPGQGGIMQVYVDTSGSPEAPEVWFDLPRMPTAGVVVAAGVVCFKPSAHGGPTPTLEPLVSLVRVDFNIGGVPTFQQIELPTEATSYVDAARRIEVAIGTPVAYTRAASKYMLRVRGAAGPGATLGFRIYETYVRLRVTDLRP